MPEGIEVRICAELISPIVKGYIITGVEISPTGRYANKDPNGLKEFREFISRESVSIIDVATRGKFMWWQFTNYHYMMCTFGMSGQWSIIKGKHPCLSIKYISDGKERQVHFNDPRHFGTISFADRLAIMNEKRSRLGWDPLQDGMNENWINYVIGVCHKTPKPIGQLLMDQSIFAGCGNYVRAESLYLAKISPWQQASLMKTSDILILCQAIVDVMKESYAHQGATILTYKDAYGAEGNYSSCFKVYGKKQDSLGNLIKKETTPEGRTIHWCPAIQK